MLFPVTVEKIQAFSESYKGSKEEAEELKSSYIQNEGDMDAIMEEVYFLTHTVRI